ncbi:type IV pilus assembly protein PilM, partial [bacterium]
VQLPPEAIVDGVIMDSSVVAEAIRNLYANLKITNRSVATSVAGHSLIVKKIVLPMMAENELETQIQWEAGQYIPFEIEDVNLDFQILGPAADPNTMEVLLVAVKKDIINDYMAVLSEAGLTVEVVDVDAFAMENIFSVSYPELMEKTVVLIDIGAGIMNINILRNGVSAFTRDITLGGSNFTEELQKDLGVSYDEAEALKLGGSSDQASVEDVGRILSGMVDSLVLEIQRSLDFFGAASSEEEIFGIYLAGGACKLSGLAESLEERQGAPVKLMQAFKEITYSQRRFDPDYLDAMGPVAVVAAGLALRRTDER